MAVQWAKKDGSLSTTRIANGARCTARTYDVNRTASGKKIGAGGELHLTRA